MPNSELKYFPQGTSAAPVAEELLNNGAVIVNGVLTADTLNRFNQEIEVHLSKSWDLEKKKHVNGLAGKSQVFLSDILCHPLYMALCDAVLKPHCATYQLNYTHVFELGPNSNLQGLHRDACCWSHFPPSDINIQLASIIALSDFTVENGATLVIPGSHRWDSDRKPEYHEAVPAVMPAGSILFYLGNTYHAAGANITQDSLRRGMHLSYILGWLRTEENNYLIAPPDYVRTLPQPIQSILGYAKHEVALAYLGVYEQSDPIELIQQGKL